MRECASECELTIPVILGAHFDSTAGGASRRSPGADDNGSGTVVVLEALRVLASSQFNPRNTIEFHFYAAEEIGLRGSQDIFRDYRAKNKSVLAFLNGDMAGYSKSGMFAMIEDYTDLGLTQYARVISQAYIGKVPLRGTCGYGCSDHASATANGFRELRKDRNFVRGVGLTRRQLPRLSMPTFARTRARTFTRHKT